MSVSADTTLRHGGTPQFWPESNSPTDLESSKRWFLEANKASLFLDAWTLPSRGFKHQVEITPISPHEISITTNISPLVSAFEYGKPFSVSLFSVPGLIPPEKVEWTSRIISRPENVWMVSEPPSATRQTQDTVPDAALENIVLSARGIRFEDGMENDFSRRLVHFVSAYGDRAVNSLNKAILDRKISPEIASEALTWLARVKDPRTYESRLRLLIKALLSPSSQVRDGASLGLALLDDPAAIPWTHLAVQLERNKELREDMAKVLSQLESRR